MTLLGVFGRKGALARKHSNTTRFQEKEGKYEITSKLVFPRHEARWDMCSLQVQPNVGSLHGYCSLSHLIDAYPLIAIQEL